MKRKNLLSDFSFWLILSILTVTIILSVMAFFGQLMFIFIYLQPFPVHHWLSWTGAAFIVLYTPVYYFLKRRYPKRYKTFLKLHIFGNILAFMLISIHFSEHISEFINIALHPETGIPLYVALFLLVLTGIMQRFQLPKSQVRRARFIHVNAVFSFYLIIVFHILRGLDIF